MNINYNIIILHGTYQFMLQLVVNTINNKALSNANTF